MPCDTLPNLIDVDATNAHVEQAARKLSGSAGISGFDSYQLQQILLRHGKHSENLRETFTKATKKQANTIVAWEEIRALKAKRLIALNKLLGVRVGIGDMYRCFEKIMSTILISGADVINGRLW